MALHETCNSILINSTAAALTTVELGFDLRKGQRL
jgi:hypothetical protein